MPAREIAPYRPAGFRRRERPAKAEAGPSAGSESAGLEALARWMDSVFVVPGLKLRFGLDALLGLLPGLGDTAASLASLYILHAASRQGVSRVTMMRMALNVGIDLVVGALPVVGDIFDVYWRANQRNVELLRRHLQATSGEAARMRRGDRWFVALVAAVIVLLVVGSAVAAYYLAAWLLAAVSRSL